MTRAVIYPPPHYTAVVLLDDEPVVYREPYRNADEPEAPLDEEPAQAGDRGGFFSAVAFEVQQ